MSVRVDVAVVLPEFIVKRLALMLNRSVVLLIDQADGRSRRYGVTLTAPRFPEPYRFVLTEAELTALQALPIDAIQGALAARVLQDEALLTPGVEPQAPVDVLYNAVVLMERLMWED